MHFNLRILQLIFLVVLAIVCVEIYRNTDIDPFGLRLPNRIEVVLLLISSIGLGIFSATMWNEVAYIVTGKRNSFKLAIVNTGLLLIGKYIPGKIWGVAARTVVNSKMDLTTGETISISIVEFASSLLFSVAASTTSCGILRDESFALASANGVPSARSNHAMAARLHAFRPS